jgi:Rps23 Pro-64 3,4-dihydroxylase Tpa1-like proline 4-hydroxylase
MDDFYFNNELIDITSIKNIKSDYEKNKIIYLNNFLDNVSAEKIYNFLNTMPEDWWYSFFNIQSNLIPLNNPIQLRNLNENKETHKFYSQMALDTFSNKLFSYSMNRTTEQHYLTCKCELCNFNAFLRSQKFISKISELTGIELTKTNEIFASKYESGNFLSPHHDKNKGKIGITFYLTKNWAPQFGGILHILSENYMEITHSFMPKFNHAVIFDIPTQAGIPHFVSHIAPNVKEKRIAITCWLE